MPLRSANGLAGSGDPNDDRMFAVDAGGQQTYLTSRYFDEHAAEFNSQKMELFSFPGQQSAPQPAYVAETSLSPSATPSSISTTSAFSRSLLAPPRSTTFMASSASTPSTSSRATPSTTEPCASA